MFNEDYINEVIDMVKIDGTAVAIASNMDGKTYICRDNEEAAAAKGLGYNLDDFNDANLRSAIKSVIMDNYAFIKDWNCKREYISQRA